MTDKERILISSLIAGNGLEMVAFERVVRPMVAEVVEKEYGPDYPTGDAPRALLEHLQADDAALLRGFAEGRSKKAFRTWLRAEAESFFAAKHRAEADRVIEDDAQNPLYNKTKGLEQKPRPDKTKEEMNIAAMIDMVELERDRMALERIDIDGATYDELSEETGLSKANLYNIHKRALERLKDKAREALRNPDNLSTVKCEQLAMDMLGVHKPLYELKSIARNSGWLSESGASIGDVGRLARYYGLTVYTRNGSADDVRLAMESGSQVIAIVDGGELTGNPFDEALEDILVGEKPDHCVSVLNIDIPAGEVVLYDPSFGDIPLTVTLSKFLDAWADSGYRYVEISNKPRT